MSNHGVFIPRQIGAMNVDIWNRHAISGSAVGDLDNGSVVRLTGKSTDPDKFEVWETALVSNAATDVLWMAYSGEEFMPGKQPSLEADNVKYFTNEEGKVFSVYRPQVHDIITLNADAINEAKSTGDLYLVPKKDQKKLSWSSTSGSGLCYKYIQDTTITFGGTSGFNTHFTSGREDAYIFECIKA